MTPDDPDGVVAGGPSGHGDADGGEIRPRGRRGRFGRAETEGSGAAAESAGEAPHADDPAQRADVAKERRQRRRGALSASLDFLLPVESLNLPEEQVRSALGMPS